MYIIHAITFLNSRSKSIAEKWNKSPSVGPSVGSSVGPLVGLYVDPSVGPSVGPSVPPSVCLLVFQLVRLVFRRLGPSIVQNVGPSVNPSIFSVSCRVRRSVMFRCIPPAGVHPESGADFVVRQESVAPRESTFHARTRGRRTHRRTPSVLNELIEC